MKDHFDYTKVSEDNICELKEKIAELEETVRVFKAALEPSRPPEYGLTAREWEIYSLVEKRKAISDEAIQAVIPLLTETGGTYLLHQSIKVHVTKLNQKLDKAEAPNRVKRIYGWGWKMECQNADETAKRNSSHVVNGSGERTGQRTH